MAAKFCAQCGAELPEEGANFCPQCGKPVTAKAAAPLSGNSGVSSSADVEAQMRELLKAGKAIAAIVLYRKATQTTLKEAKAKAEELIRKYNIPPPTLPPLGQRLRNRLIVSVVLGLLLAGVVHAALPGLGRVAARLICERLIGSQSRLLCPDGGAFTWQPFAAALVVCLAGIFLLISILKLFSKNTPQLWKAPE